MEMEDDHNHNHHHHHHHQYANMADLRQLINGGAPRPPPHFPADLFAPSAAASGHLSPAAQPHQFEMMMVGTEIIPPRRALQQDFGADNATVGGGGGEGDLGGAGGGDSGSGRWPRQETLTLLEIRSRLDPKFKEANHKGPLWDEVSRIMCEEHGYQRRGKKCREKFENLYKYYKKTKEGKAGRQDGKHYRFFRQLEALYGETSNNNSQVSVPETHLVNNISRFHSSQSNPQDHGFQSHPKLCDSLSLSANSSEFDTSSSEDNDPSTAVDNESMEKRRKRRGGRSWRAKIKDFIDSQMRKLMEKQEAWLEKVMTTLEHKEQERALREEEWRKQETARVDREHELWAKERAWIETRDTALMEMLEKIKGRGRDLSLMKGSSPEERIGGKFQNQSENQNENGSEILNNNNASTRGSRDCWEEPEITRLIQLRSSLESRLQQNGQNHSCDELLWEEIAAKMSCYGYERSSLACKEKWDAINYYLIKKTKEERNKKHKENSRNSSYFHNNDPSMYNQGQGGSYCEIINEQGPPEAMAAVRQVQPNDGSSPSSSNAGNAVQDSCFRFLMGDGDQHNLWETYGLKLNKGQNQ